jgi:hypothetical protein
MPSTYENISTDFSNVTLASSRALACRLYKQMGSYAFIRYCRNLGYDLDDTLALVRLCTRIG